MFRYCLTIEYKGTGFCGWQRQPNLPSIQGSLEEAIKKFSSENVKVQAAGRTDAGVHARGQVVHFDLQKKWDSFRISEALNYHLRPLNIVVLKAKSVKSDFNARFSAVKRHYEYIILNRRPPPCLERDLVWHVAKKLDIEKMAEAAKMVEGLHDFTTFRSLECQAKSPIKTIDSFTISRKNDHIYFRISAPSFLHHQVRSLVGSLKMVGEGKWTIDDFAMAFAAKDRKACAALAPSCGLYLMKVDYS